MGPVWASPSSSATQRERGLRHSRNSYSHQSSHEGGNLWAILSLERQGYFYQLLLYWSIYKIQCRKKYCTDFPGALRVHISCQMKLLHIYTYYLVFSSLRRFFKISSQVNFLLQFYHGRRDSRAVRLFFPFVYFLHWWKWLCLSVEEAPRPLTTHPAWSHLHGQPRHGRHWVGSGQETFDLFVSDSTVWCWSVWARETCSSLL